MSDLLEISKPLKQYAIVLSSIVVDQIPLQTELSQHDIPMRESNSKWNLPVGDSDQHQILVGGEIASWDV